MKYTNKDVENRFTRFCKIMGKRVARDGSDVGAWTLDYYKGWRIEEIYNEFGSVITPFGNKRYSANELVHMMDFVIDAITLKEEINNE